MKNCIVATAYGVLRICNGVRPQIDSLGKHVFPGKLVVWVRRLPRLFYRLFRKLPCFLNVGSGSFSAYCSDGIQAPTLEQTTKAESSYANRGPNTTNRINISPSKGGVSVSNTWGAVKHYSRMLRKGAIVCEAVG